MKPSWVPGKAFLKARPPGPLAGGLLCRPLPHCTLQVSNLRGKAGSGTCCSSAFLLRPSAGRSCSLPPTRPCPRLPETEAKQHPRNVSQSHKAVFLPTAKKMKKKKTSPDNTRYHHHPQPNLNALDQTLGNQGF